MSETQTKTQAKTQAAVQGRAESGTETGAQAQSAGAAVRTVHVAVYDTYADWETGHTTAHLTQHGYEVRTVGVAAGRPVTTMGGLRIQPDLALDDLRPEESALLILTGAGLWDAGDELAPFAAKAEEFLAAGIPVAAICGATAGLARAGVLDGRTHTSAAPFYLGGQPGYAGAERYVEADAVTDGDLITAGPTEPVAFAREVFSRLGVYEPHVLDAWYRLFHDSDESAYPVLMAAAQPETGQEREPSDA
ncbi:type 1 glutamine amidotransferase family protein [Streptomyces sp. NBC_00347]|uniref:type 1 glutamine amidotransferase family protein n=1 Tax=Streptomyces sp. NBC_00347 TaxID=2975721 RepID=UPI002257D49D|nr:type 1 glutamine amidotransferase family protein [Streptomyces sp. NBC_00347]MCX5123602.1 glutamine amidotransferase [Streptomyces sp. NBC_00347]